MEPGTVVVLNRTKSNEVMPSFEPYDAWAAGSTITTVPGASGSVTGTPVRRVAVSFATVPMTTEPPVLLPHRAIDAFRRRMSRPAPSLGMVLGKVGMWLATNDSYAEERTEPHLDGNDFKWTENCGGVYTSQGK